MKLIDKFLYVFFKGKADILYVYDKSLDKIIEFKRKDFEFVKDINFSEDDFHSLSIEEQYVINVLASIISNNDRYFIIPNKKDINEKEIKELFSEFIGDNKILKLNKKDFNDYLKKNKLKAIYDNFYEEVCIELLEDFISDNKLEVPKLNKKDFNKLVNIAMEINNLKPWEYFSDIDLIKIKYNNKNYYFSILGANSTCYGISFNIGKSGINSMLMQQELANTDPDSLLPGIITNNNAVYYDYFYDTYDEEAAENIKKYIDDVDDNGIYPSFSMFKIGKFPVQIKDKSDVNIFYNALLALKKFLIGYIKNPIKKHDSTYIEAKITAKDIYYRETNYFNDGTIRYDVPKISFELLNDFQTRINVVEDIGYFNVHVIPQPDEDNDAVILPLLYSENNDNLIPIEPMVIFNNDVMSSIAVNIIHTLDIDNIPNKIYVKNYLCLYLLKFLFGNKIDIIFKNNDVTDKIFLDMVDRIIENPIEC